MAVYMYICTLKYTYTVYIYNRDVRTMPVLRIFCEKDNLCMSDQHHIAYPDWETKILLYCNQ